MFAQAAEVLGGSVQSEDDIHTVVLAVDPSDMLPYLYYLSFITGPHPLSLDHRDSSWHP